jgi:outer membrane murein-binding lipoprotein Lpp
VISHPSVAGAAVLAGLMVAGGTYAARHDVGLGSGLQASAAARASLEQELPLGRERHVARHILSWHPPHVPKIHVHARPPAAPVTISAPAPTYVTAAPVASTAPVTRTSPSAPVTKTSPVGGDDGSGDD